MKREELRVKNGLAQLVCVGLFFILFSSFFVSNSVQAQSATTGVQGKVVDAETGEGIPFVQIFFDGTQVSTESDMDGKFSISNEQGYTTVSFRMMG